MAIILCFTFFSVFVVLWVRSFDLRDIACGDLLGIRGYQIDSCAGEVTFITSAASRQDTWLEFGSQPFDRKLRSVIHIPLTHSMLGISWESAGADFHLIVPHRLLVLVTMALAALLGMQCPPRFSVRGLFVAVTIVAIVLSMAVKLGR